MRIKPGGKGNNDINELLRGELSQNGYDSYVKFFPSGSGCKLKPGNVKPPPDFRLIVTCHIGHTEILKIKSNKFKIFSEKGSGRFKIFERR